MLLAIALLGGWVVAVVPHGAVADDARSGFSTYDGPQTGIATRAARELVPSVTLLAAGIPPCVGRIGWLATALSQPAVGCFPLYAFLGVYRL
jgi:hypothetical protein